MSQPDVYVFDTTPLTHFARAGLTSELQAICNGVTCVALREVVVELKSGLGQFPQNRAILDAEWIDEKQLGIDGLMLFAEYAERVGARGERDVGECATLAWAQIHSAIAIIDDQVARNAAEARGVEVHGTAWLITRGIKGGVLTNDEADAIADRLLNTNIRLPFGKAEFTAWARKEGLLE